MNGAVKAKIISCSETLPRSTLHNIIISYIARSARGQDEANPKMGPSCPLGIARIDPAHKKIELELIPGENILLHVYFVRHFEQGEM